MNIGEPKRTIEIEPVTVPVPEPLPVEEPAPFEEPAPVEEPALVPSRGPEHDPAEPAEPPADAWARSPSLPSPENRPRSCSSRRSAGACGGSSAEPDGRPLLVSPMQRELWQPMEPSRARCNRYPHSHRAPHEDCMCGFYAASSPERLRSAGVPLSNPTCCVIGSVALWGRVIEHRMGWRGEFGYPDRMRLVCARCFAEARETIPTRVFAGGGGELIARHADVHLPDADLLLTSPTELQDRLLSTYAVDLLPVESLGETLLGSRMPRPMRALATQAKRETRALVRSWVGWLGALVVVVVFFQMRAGDPVVPAGSPWSSPVTSPRHPHVSPLAGAGDRVRERVRERSPPTERRPRVRLAFICGRLGGDAVTLVGVCRRSGLDLLRDHVTPTRVTGECGMDGYTRKPRFSVCWFGVPVQMDPELTGSHPPHPTLWRLPRVHSDDIFRGSLTVPPRPRMRATCSDTEMPRSMSQPERGFLADATHRPSPDPRILRQEM